MGWSPRKSPREKAEGSPPIPPRTHGHGAPLESRDFLKQEVCLPPPHLYSFIPSLRPPSIQNHIWESLKLDCMPLVPRKITTYQKEITSKTPPGRPAESSKSIPSLGNQPSGASAKGGAGVPAGASDGPVIHTTGNKAVAEFLGTWALWSLCPRGQVLSIVHVAKMLYFKMPAGEQWQKSQPGVCLLPHAVRGPGERGVSMPRRLGTPLK